MNRTISFTRMLSLFYVFDNAKVRICCAFGLKTPIHAPKMGKRAGTFDPLMESSINMNPKRNPCCVPIPLIISATPPHSLTVFCPVVPKSEPLQRIGAIKYVLLYLLPTNKVVHFIILSNFSQPKQGCYAENWYRHWLWLFFIFFKIAAVHHLGCVGHILGPPAKSSWRLIIMQNLVGIAAVNTNVWIFRAFGLEKPIHAPKMGVWDFDPLNRSNSCGDIAIFIFSASLSINIASVSANGVDLSPIPSVSRRSVSLCVCPESTGCGKIK